ncbi:MAG: RagB/SusD family nutrient uptake outer membrane protein [Arenibacter algicola]
MKNKFIYIVIIACSLSIYSCDDDLEIPPKNIISAEQVFTNELAVQAYLANLYIQAPIEGFNFSANNGFNNWSSGVTTAHASGEALSEGPRGNVGDGNWWQWWSAGYKAVREVNGFISNIAETELSEEQKQAYTAEAKFIRAYCYFGLVKRYGGVPIITEVQMFNGDNLDELQLSRNTELEVYSFIGEQLDEAIDMLPETNESGRANSFVAQALKSRVMLYAATLAKYAEVDLDGVVGIPSSEANRFFKASYDAAKNVIESGNYQLWDVTADKIENYTSLFIETEGNPEVIFKREYKFPDLTHSYDLWNLPFGVRGPAGYSSRMNPTLEMVEKYEYIDGSEGTLKMTDPSGVPIHYDNPMDLFVDKDPRCLATVIVPFSPWQETTIDVQKGIIDDLAISSNLTVYGRNAVTTGGYNNLYNPTTHTIDENGTLPVITINGVGGSERSVTGFYIRKYMDYNKDKSQAFPWNSTQSWIDIRYGEVLLNYAEAAFELGEIPDAKWAVNLIRERAGIAELSDAEVTLDRVRHEREVELAFENHYYWDIRRWRTGHNLIETKRYNAIHPFYDLQADDYVFARQEMWFDMTFYFQLYYEKIPVGAIEANPKLIQNPLY